MARKFKVTASRSINNYVDFRVYTTYTDEYDDTEEIECVHTASTLEGAEGFVTKFMNQYMDDEVNGMHIVAVPTDEDDPAVKDYFEYTLGMDMYEVVRKYHS